MKRITLAALVCTLLVGLTAGCNRNALTGSKLTLDNYNQVTTGMSKAQVERIMGPPTTTETKDMLIFKKTTYRYEEGHKFVLFTFKNDELDTKEGNLGYSLILAAGFECDSTGTTRGARRECFKHWQR